MATEYTYCTSDDVYRTTGLTSTLVSAANVIKNIQEAEVIACKITRNIYWSLILNIQTASSGGNTTITKTGAAWTVNDYALMYVWVYSGTGSGQIRQILSNTADTLTVDRAWTVNPATGSVFRIFYVPSSFNPYINDSYDGNGMTYQYMPYYPVNLVESLTIAGTSVTVSKTYLYDKIGKIMLKTTAEYPKFSKTYPQEIAVVYWYGVYILPYDVKRLVELKASIQSLNYYLMTVAGTPSNISLPEMTITNPQAYQVARETQRMLTEECEELMKSIKVWPVFG
jgi:hypothetical protein